MRLKRFLPDFRRLQWKLTLTYTLVTTVAILVVEVVLLIVAGYIMLRSDVLPRMLVPSFQEVAGDLVPYLRDDVPDQEALARWLKEFVRTGELRRGRQVQLDLDPMLVAFAAVVDREGRVLGIEPASLCDPRALLQDCVQSPVAAIVDNALAGVMEAARLVVRTGSGFVLATPIVDENGDVLGGLVLQISIPLTATQFITQGARALFPSTLGVMGFAALVGTVFGFFTARGLTRRLNRLMLAADAWSRGDFTVVVRDASQDELGLLAQRLNRMAEQLQNLLQAREELAALEERNRLARDLHDSVKQQVFATAMQVAAARNLLDANPAQARVHLEEAERLARQAQQELTVLIRELRPAALEGKGLVAALREHVAEWSRQTGIEADLRVQGERPLPLHVEQALFRIAQEALSNVARHSGAARAVVHLAWGARYVAMTVEDNGRGFDVEAAWEKGLGLRSMEERARRLHGDLQVESRAGEGTRVIVRCPV